MKKGTGTILIVEDEPHDVEFLERAFKHAGIVNPLQFVTNGEQAVAYLTGAGEYADRARFPYPRVIITDLKMPQMGGLELLRWLQANPKYRVMPIIVLTSSTSQADVDTAFAHGAAAYFVKPVGVKELDQIAKAIWDYWRLSLMPRCGE
jgi:CheY-like chemotaxis protein